VKDRRWSTDSPRECDELPIEVGAVDAVAVPEVEKDELDG
jgi:hypothetical protein